MAKNDNVLTVRLSEDVLTKFEELLETYNRQHGRVGDKPVEKREIIEEAIRDLYYKKINESQDADVVKRINNMVDDKINSSLNNLKKTIDDIWFMAKKNELGNKLLYRSPSMVPSPPSVPDAINIIVNEESRWNNALEEYMYTKYNKEKTEKYHQK